MFSETIQFQRVSMSTESNLTCQACPGSSRCLIAEAENLLSELCKDKIRAEITDIRWMLSLGDDGLEKPDQAAMLSLLSKLQRVLHEESPAALFSVATQIAESKRLQTGLQ
jgi:hypothetical protein